MKSIIFAAVVVVLTMVAAIHASPDTTDTREAVRMTGALVLVVGGIGVSVYGHDFLHGDTRRISFSISATAIATGLTILWGVK